jgi:hypothetical protein
MRSIFIVLLLATPAFSQGFFAVGEGLCWRPWSSDFRNQYDSDLAINHDWAPGVRGEVGYEGPLGWKGSWTYTWFAADDARAWDDVVIPGDQYTSYGDLDYQVHDFEVGRVFCLYRKLEIEAFGGFRWGQIDYSLRDAVSGRTGNQVDLNSFTDSYGVRVGGKAKCYLPGQFSLFGEGAFSGLFSTTRNWGSTQSPGTSWDETDNHENHAVDAAAGVAWRCGLVEVAGGYEWNWWANSIQRRSETSQPDYDNLLLEGAFLRVTGRY